MGGGNAGERECDGECGGGGAEEIAENDLWLGGWEGRRSTDEDREEERSSVMLTCFCCVDEKQGGRTERRRMGIV